MSDLISREAVINAIADTILNGESLGYVLAEEIVSEIPSADIMECARALKKHCSNTTDCKECFMWDECEYELSAPCDWDLPEGEAKPNESLIKDCCEAQGHLWADNNIFEDVEENQ